MCTCVNTCSKCHLHVVAMLEDNKRSIVWSLTSLVRLCALNLQALIGAPANRLSCAGEGGWGGGMFSALLPNPPPPRPPRKRACSQAIYAYKIPNIIICVQKRSATQLMMELLALAGFSGFFGSQNGLQASRRSSYQILV